MPGLSTISCMKKALCVLAMVSLALALIAIPAVAQQQAPLQLSPLLTVDPECVIDPKLPGCPDLCKINQTLPGCYEPPIHPLCGIDSKLPGCSEPIRLFCEISPAFPGCSKSGEMPNEGRGEQFLGLQFGEVSAHLRASFVSENDIGQSWDQVAPGEIENLYADFLRGVFDTGKSGQVHSEPPGYFGLAEAHDSGIADDRRPAFARDAAEWMPTYHRAWFAAPGDSGEDRVRVDRRSG